MLKDVEETIEKFREQAENLTKHMLQQTGGIQPTLAILKQVDGKYQFGIVGNISDVFFDDNKTIFVEAIKYVIEHEKPIAIAVITEGWMVTREPGKEPKGRVSEESDRIEVVHLSVETADNTGHTLWDLMRDKEAPYLVEKERLSLEKKDNRVKGNFTNLLRKNYEEFHGKLVDTITNSLN